MPPTSIDLALTNHRTTPQLTPKDHNAIGSRSSYADKVSSMVERPPHSKAGKLNKPPTDKPTFQRFSGSFCESERTVICTNVPESGAPSLQARHEEEKQRWNEILKEVELKLPAVNLTRLSKPPISPHAELHPSGQPFPREAQLTGRSSVSYLYTNTQGLLSKLAEFRDTMASGTFSLVGLTETWLTHEIMDAEIAIPGFSVLRSDRGSQGGGVALYYSTQLKPTVINDPPFQSRETLWCMLPLDATGLCLVAVIYRPPNNSPEADTLLLSDLNQFLARGHTQVLLMGDFNCPQLHTRVHSSGSFQAELLALCDLIPLYNHVLQPARFRSNDTPSILDLLLTNEELMIEGVHYLPPLGASDHMCPQFDFVCCAYRVADVSIFTRRHVNFSLLRNLLLANTLSKCAFADSDTAWRDFAFFFQTLILIATITTNLPVASI
ncbi:hypothetical protein P879_10858 [Paragonimus westermani]|uniref:Endonuclease/exonuclease/phosphatase domain-containing protein n=1 Tax=Paragonimus westermani TaxID=34504 RepID=A0A8T0DGV9_9TREM|nr:hypothetical protein P879_10858 [Paragonimus westermani]